jgi:L-malate glycosyltransferase
MRVAIIVTRIDQAGPIFVIQNLVNSLVIFNDLVVKVFYLDKKVNPQLKMIVPCMRFDSRKFRFADYDIVHTNGIRPDLLAFLNRRKIRYHISTLHNLVFEDLTFTYNHLISFIFGNIWLMIWNRADKLVCVSEAVKTYYSKWFPKSKLKVICNGIAEIDSSFSPEYDVIQSVEKFHSSGLKVIGSIGVLTCRKGIDQLLYLLAAEKNLALVIIGSGKEYLNLMHLSAKLNISERCLFCGFRSNASVYLKYFDLFIMPSRSEGFGLVLIEAVQQRVPVICSDIDVFRELFTGDEVTFFKLEDLDSLSESVRTAIETGFKKTETAYERFRNNYTALTMSKHYYKLYQSASVFQVA